MISDVSICNQALSKLGTQTIVSLTEENKTARRCNLIYEQIRDSVLRDHTWSFGTKIEELALLAYETVVNWDYLYIIPVDCLFVIKIFDQNNLDTNNYDKLLSPDTNTPIIATNIAQAYMRYILRVRDSNLLDNAFVQAFIARLASELAIPLTGDLKKAEYYRSEYVGLVETAKRADAQEKNIKIDRESKYYKVR